MVGFRVQRRLLVSVLVPLLAATNAHANAADCGLPAAAFCETFDAPAGDGDRSGDLDGTLWGVSRQLGAVNFGQGQYYDVAPAVMHRCGEDVTVLAPNDVVAAALKWRA